MNAETTQYKRTLRGSIGAGIGSLFDGNGRSYFILEHKNSSAYHKAGESQKIIVDQIEIGRDASCQVQFDESFPTVSRKHAAIVRDGNNWKLIHLSQTNCTLLNGRIIENEWYLQNGDEIQLSAGGPKLGFIIPAGKQSLVSSIKMTERLELFRKQALAPYKTAIACLAVILVLSVAGLVTWNVMSEQKHQEELAKVHKTQEEYEKVTEELMRRANVLEIENDDLIHKYDSIRNEIPKLIRPNLINNSIPADVINKARESVYLIYVKEITLTNRLGIRETLRIEDAAESNSILKNLFVSGTGFMLEDGTFVTAKHVVQPHLFIRKGDPVCLINSIVTDSGLIEYVFHAVSTVDSFEFTEKQIVCDRTQECIFSDVPGLEPDARCTISPLNGSDWAYIKTSRTGNLKMDAKLSKNLTTGTNLSILGYPGGNSGDHMESVLGSCMVALDGISRDKVIWTTERNFEQGNSGGPVFAITKNNQLTVVALVSAGTGSTLGFLVPMSNINYF